MSGIQVRETVGNFRFHKWYNFVAVYLDGELIYFGDGRPGGMWWTILGSWGYHLDNGEEIPSCPTPDGFDKQPNGNWQPPKMLEVLERQIASYKAKKRRDHIAYHREELARLEAEELK